MSGFKSGIKISLSAKKPESPAASLASSTKSKVPSVAAVFQDSEDSEPEEMPAEARIRMRNIGKHTPTSAGPNSYGKTNRGFTDRRAEIEKQLRLQLDQASDESDPVPRRKPLASTDLFTDSKKAVNERLGEEPPSKKTRASGPDHGDGVAKIGPLKNSFTDVVQDVHADEEASDS